MIALSTPQPEVKEGEKCNCLITNCDCLIPAGHFTNVLWDTEKPIEPEQGGEDESSEVLKYLNTISPNDEIGVREKLYELGMINVVMSMMDHYANHKLSGVKALLKVARCPICDGSGNYY